MRAFIKSNKDKKILVSDHYNYFFDKKTGYFARWGKTMEDDPQYSPYGPEILDIEVTTICDNGCPFCSPKGTKILTSSGTKNIENIKVGDKVIGYNHITNKIESNKVAKIYSRDYNGDIIIIKDRGKTLFLTPEHEIFTENRGYVKAEDLNTLDIVKIIEH